jgi:hypothetical protein
MYKQAVVAAKEEVMFAECKTVAEAIQYALDRSLAVKVQPGWRSFDTEREGVFVHLLSEEGHVILEHYVSYP